MGLIKSVAVEKEYRRRGIGTQLIVEAMRRLKNKGCDLFFAVSWDSGFRDSSPSIFKALSFMEAVKIDNYWTEDSKEKDKETGEVEIKYMCPADGWPCHCSAIFFFRK